METAYFHLIIPIFFETIESLIYF